MRSIAITSGKGGVGKTNLSANLSIALSRLRQRVVVFDADIGLANLDVVLGCKVDGTLQHVVAGERTLRDVLHSGPSGIRFIPGGSGVESLVDLSDAQKDRFFSELESLERDVDVMIFDTGAGIDGNVMSFLKAADEVIVVVTPDPASLTDGYATIKALFRENPGASVKLVVNMVESELEAKQVYSHLYAVVQKFLAADLRYGGFVRLDPGAVSFIRKRVPFVIGNPHLPASQDISRIASNLMGQPRRSQDGGVFGRLKSMFGLAKAA